MLPKCRLILYKHLCAFGCSFVDALDKTRAVISMVITFFVLTDVDISFSVVVVLKLIEPFCLAVFFITESSSNLWRKGADVSIKNKLF